LSNGQVVAIDSMDGETVYVESSGVAFWHQGQKGLSMILPNGKRRRRLCGTRGNCWTTS